MVELSVESAIHCGLWISGWQNKQRMVMELIWKPQELLRKQRIESNLVNICAYSSDIINKGKQIIICNLLDPVHKVQARVFQFPANIISICKNSCKNIIYYQHWLRMQIASSLKFTFIFMNGGRLRGSSIWINHSK
jgi:hypothetical protein